MLDKDVYEYLCQLFIFLFFFILFFLFVSTKSTSGWICLWIVLQKVIDSGFVVVVVLLVLFVFLHEEV